MGPPKSTGAEPHLSKRAPAPVFVPVVTTVPINLGGRVPYPTLRSLQRLAALLNPGHHVRMRAYSEDLRRKIVEAVQRGMGHSEAARSFGVSLSSVKRYIGTLRKGGSFRPKKHPGSKSKIDERGRRLLESDVEERPTLSLLERCRLLEQTSGMRVSESTMSRVLRHLGFSRKKGAWEQVSVTNGLARIIHESSMRVRFVR